MIKLQRGEKRICPSCGVRFYDMARAPIVCPGCQAKYSDADFVKLRRARVEPSAPTAKEQPAAGPAPAPTPTPARRRRPGRRRGIRRSRSDASELGEDEDDGATWES